MEKKKEILLNLGSGVHLYSGFINVDNYFTLEDLQKGIETKEGLYKNAVIEEGAEFVKADICKLPFEDNFADYIECIDVIEHISFYKIHLALAEIYRVLKVGGKAVLFTNDFDSLAMLWINNLRGKVFNVDKWIELRQLIYGNQIGEGEYHKTPINKDVLYFLLRGVGFKHKDIKMSVYPYGSEDKPPFRGQKWPEGKLTLRSGMLFVKLTK